jgi:copper chaperone CopZ
MRALLWLPFVFAACQRPDPAERSAELTSRAQVSPAPAATTTTATAPEQHACGCGMQSGAGCTSGGQCGGQCGGASPELVAPANASWTKLHVAGMHCGGCARRIERALAGIDGVVGVRADFAHAEVEVATAGGVDARRLAAPVIDGLGYRVE